MENSKRTALYCRTAQRNHEGIQVQKALLLLYADEHGHENTIVYSDNGYSGLNFDRPGFAQMQSDISAGKIKTVLVKDLSRISRDTFKVFDWVENGLGDAQLISVIDGYDSKASNPIADALKRQGVYLS